jgi:hypothetical protein
MLDYLAAGQPLDESLDDFPTVKKAIAVAALEGVEAGASREMAMRALLDECLPHELKNELTGH